MRLRPYLALLLTVALSRAAAAQSFTLTSADVKPGQKIPNPQVFNGMGCAGNNVSPALQWHNAPAGTKSFVLTVYDPDAPTGSGWWHWVLYDIPANATQLAAGAGSTKTSGLPAGAVQGKNDAGTPGYMGPCPPVGDAPHHYQFTLYALDVAKLDVPAGASPAYVGFNVHSHTKGKATFTSLYGR